MRSITAELLGTGINPYCLICVSFSTICMVFLVQSVNDGARARARPSWYLRQRMASHWHVSSLSTNALSTDTLPSSESPFLGNSGCIYTSWVFPILTSLSSLTSLGGEERREKSESEG